LAKDAPIQHLVKKFNTKSSTKAKQVAVDDAMGQLLWTRHFLAAQSTSSQSLYRELHYKECDIILKLPSNKKLCMLADKKKN